MKLRNKIIIGYLVIAALCGLLCLIGIQNVTSIQNEYLKVSSETLPVMGVLEELKVSGMTIVASTSEYLFIQAEKDHANINSTDGKQNNTFFTDHQSASHEMDELSITGYNALKLNLYKYEGLVLQRFHHEKPYLKLIKKNVFLLIDNSEEIITSKRNGMAGNAILSLKEEFEETEELFLDAINTAISHEKAELVQRNALVESSISTAIKSLLLAASFIFILSLSGGLLLARALAGPVEELRKAAIDISKGNLDISIEPKSHDEIGELATTFNQMVQTLKGSQHELLMMKEYSDSIIESMSEALIILSAEGIIVRGNFALYNLTAYDEQDLRGRNIKEVLKDERLFEEGTFVWLETSNQPLSAESILESQVGEQIVVQMMGSWVCDPQNDQGQLVLIFQDVREHKASEEKLAANKNFLETILDNMVEEISILDPYDFTIIKANEAFRTAYQVSEEELVGDFCHKVTHGLSEPCQPPNDYCPIADALKSRAAISCEHIHITESGGTKYCEIQVAPIFAFDGSINHVIHVSRDITERKVAEKALQTFAEQQESNNILLIAQAEELEEAHQELKESQSRILQQDKMASIGQLAAGVAHEINNPMGFIISNLNTLDKYMQKLAEYDGIQTAQLSDQAQEDVRVQRKRLKIDYMLEDIPELLSESLDGADRVKKIVQDLKGFSRIDQAEFGSVDLNACIDSTINIVWNEIKYNATLERDYRLDNPVACFAQQLTQVFINLLVNASHALEEQGEIRISTWQEGEDALISITDSGKGMPAEISQRIFEPFYTTKEVGKGTGLGLSIVYDIIKKHHGEIRVESEPGKGTCFTIQIPLQQEEPSTQAIEGSAESA